MKKTILKAVVATVITATSLISCTSSEQKVENAENKVTDAKENLKEVKKDSGIAAQKIATENEWKIFKNDAETTVKNNEIRIAGLKDKMKNAGAAAIAAYSKKIDDMEMQNHNLKLKIENYEKHNSDWESFKTEFNHDVNELGQALKDFTINNKK
ncbi:MAG: hypothetical protein ACOVO1_07360 [Chitinophagaceae bacterium]